MILFSVLSSIFIGLGILFLVTWFNELELLNVLSFGTSGPFFFLVLIIYSLLGTITAFLAKKNNYRILLLIFSITLLIYSLIITYVGMFGFREP